MSSPEIGLIIIGLFIKTIMVLAFDNGNRMIEEARQRFSNALSYPEESEMGLFFALAVPLDDPVSTKAISVAFFFEANYKLPNYPDEAVNEETRNRIARSINRTSIYNILETKFESLGYPGRQCLLRSICETARDIPLLGQQHNNGLVGDLMRITFMPSSTIDEGLPMEYYNAEIMDENDCSTTYNKCPFSIYQYITDISDDIE